MEWQSPAATSTTFSSLSSSMRCGSVQNFILWRSASSTVRPMMVWFLACPSWPFLLYPKDATWLVVSTTRVWSSPSAAVRTLPSRRRLRLSSGRFTPLMVSSPSCPYEFLPHRNILPVSEMAAECQPPSTILQTPRPDSVATLRGRPSGRVPACPSCPNSPSPHVYTSRSLVMQALWKRPAAICTTKQRLSSRIGVGIADMLVPTELMFSMMPSWPMLPLPHAKTAPSTVRAMVCSAPQATSCTENLDRALSVTMCCGMAKLRIYVKYIIIIKL
mmetsp:Transcript_19394/g.53832  ORF Transcript_19394/g.53832 Transcript_19394/m.53832 type:complete len:274 (+) Transcript_19394:396-1217(+)